MTPLFAGTGLCKNYGVQRALDRVDFEVATGEVVGLVGANGAGKSTLLKILAGAIAPDEGELKLDGQPVRMHSMRDAAERGVALVSQELNLFPALSVRENLAIVGSERGTSGAKRDAAARATLADLGLDVSLGTRLERLSLGDRQLVEIARALLQNPRVLIFDEPTSALHRREKERLLALVKRLSGTGVGIVYVSHFLEELLGVATTLVVLRDGKRVPTQIIPAKERLGDVVSAMLGESAAQNLRHDTSKDASAASRSRSAVLAGPLQISGLVGPLQLDVPSWSVPAGTVVGVAGLAGAGVEELFALLFGRLQAKRGEIVLPSGGAAPRSAAEAVERGVAYIPADRKRIGLMLRKSVAENIWSVRTLVQGRDGFFLRNARLNAIATASCNLLGVKAAGIDVSADALSGGNQQKVVFAKWLEANPSLVLLDDPTRGVDIGAKREMHRIIRGLADDGRVVLMYSSDPLELVNVAERVHVFVDGNLRDELAGAALTEHALVSAMNMRAASESAGGVADRGSSRYFRRARFDAPRPSDSPIARIRYWAALPAS